MNMPRRGAITELREQIGRLQVEREQLKATYDKSVYCQKLDRAIDAEIAALERGEV